MTYVKSFAYSALRRRSDAAVGRCAATGGRRIFMKDISLNRRAVMLGVAALPMARRSVSGGFTHLGTIFPWLCDSAGQSVWLAGSARIRMFRRVTTPKKPAQSGRARTAARTSGAISTGSCGVTRNRSIPHEAGNAALKANSPKSLSKVRSVRFSAEQS